MNPQFKSDDEDELVPDFGFGDWPEVSPNRNSLLVVLAVFLAVILTLGGFFAWTTLMPVDHHARAIEFLEVADYPSAIIELKQVIQQNPYDGEMRWLIGSAYLQIDQPTTAIEYLRGSFDLGYKSPELLLTLARTQLLIKEYEEALKWYRDWSDVESNVQAAAWEVVRGGALLNLGKHESALQAYLEALRLDPSNGEAKWGLSQAGLGVRLSDLPSETIQRALATGLDQPETWLLKGELALSRANFLESRIAFEKAVELAPLNVYALAGLVRVLMASNQLRDATETITVLTQQFPNDPMSAYTRALYASGLQQYDLALDNLNIVLEHQPNHAMGILLLGEVQLALGKTTRAKEILTRFYELLPNNLRGRKKLAEVLIESGELQEAVELLEPLIDETLRDADVATLLATAYSKMGDTRRGRAYQALSLKLDAERATATLALETLDRGDTGQALEDLELLVGQNPDKVEKRIKLAVTNLRLGDFARAREISSALLAQAPDDPKVQYAHATVLEMSSDAASAASHYERALRLDPQFSVALLALARIDLDSGRREAARERIEALLEADPDNTTAQVRLAQLAMHDGDFQSAIRRFEAIRARDKAALQPRLILADIYLQLDDGEKALKVSREVVNLSPNHPVGNYLLGNALVMEGDYEEGLLLLSQLEDTYPDNLKLKWRIVEAQEKLGDLQAASVTLQRVLDLVRENARVLTKLAILERHRGNSDAALELASRLAELHPTSGMGFLIKGQRLLDSGDYLVASDLLERAFVLNNDSVSVSPYYTALALAGETDKAADVMASWLEGNPMDAVARLAVAEVAARNGDYTQAIEGFEWVARHDPNNVAVLIRLASAYREKGDRRDLKTAQKAYELDPQNLAAKHLYGRLMVDAGLSKRGAEILREVVDRQPENPTFRYHLAEALNESGSTEQARQVLQPLAQSQVDYAERAEAEALMKMLGLAAPHAKIRSG